MIQEIAETAREYVHLNQPAAPADSLPFGRFSYGSLLIYLLMIA